MIKYYPRASLTLLFIIFSVCLVSCVRGNKHDFDIPSGEATKTLKLFALQADVDVLINESELEGIQTNTVKGSLPIETALKTMILGTNLKFHQDEQSKAIAIFYSDKK